MSDNRPLPVVPVVRAWAWVCPNCDRTYFQIADPVTNESKERFMRSEGVLEDWQEFDPASDLVRQTEVEMVPYQVQCPICNCCFLAEEKL